MESCMNTILKRKGIYLDDMGLGMKAGNLVVRR
jgi:hypothetical protein